MTQALNTRNWSPSCLLKFWKYVVALLHLVVIKLWWKKCLPSEEKLKSSRKDVSGVVKDLLHIHESIEKRKILTRKLQATFHVYFNEKGLDSLS